MDQTMDFFDHPYYRTGKNVTRLIGRWPYQKYWESRICSFITIFLCTSQFIAEVIKSKFLNDINVMCIFNILQIFGVIIYGNDKEIILESITPFMIDVVVAVKYINAVFNLKTVGYLPSV